MTKIPILVLIISLAISTSAVQAKDNNDKADFFSIKKEQSVCDRNSCPKSLGKVTLDLAKDKKARKQKPANKFKKHKKHKHNGKPAPVEAVPEINGGGSAMAFLLAAALILTVREKRKSPAI